MKDLPIRIVYYKEGAIKSQFDSLDKIAAPFIIDGQPNSLNILNTPIYFKIMSPRKVAFNWTLNYQSYSDTLEHSPWIKNEFFNLEVHVAPMIPQEKMSANYYFIFK